MVASAWQQTGARLEAVAAEGGVLEELGKALQVALPAHVGQVGHHVRDHLHPPRVSAASAAT